MEYIKDEEYKYVTLLDVLKQYRNIYAGAILFSFDIGDINLNIASSLSGVLDYI